MHSQIGRMKLPGTWMHLWVALALMVMTGARVEEGVKRPSSVRQVNR